MLDTRIRMIILIATWEFMNNTEEIDWSKPNVDGSFLYLYPYSMI